MNSNVENYIKDHPEVEHEIKHNLVTYGVPFLYETSEVSGRNIVEGVEKILEEKSKVRTFDIRIYPQDESGNKYTIEYTVLRALPDGLFERALDYEREYIRR